ncbi:hypothetical protein RND81_11G218900 [Saponaria officinalis]|uniref:Uncharacterized protein n=1 Tax=Saponaria officinalis TaxID=3572 RepID=A0AAW1HRH8_SAPOF
MLPSNENSGSNAPYDTRPFPRAPILGGQSTASYGNNSIGLGRIGSWSTGLFDCLDDPTNCIITALLPCYTFGQIAEIVNKGEPGCVASGVIEGAICVLTSPIHWLYPFI